ncbi:nodulation S family protein [Jatrophihabitans telluris]|uniref:Nodulation S family protein n=1 Tax=Jatrophihabitans telluris TaxID=2038343 RepID=A0ABY4R0N0_9ACTN|nr:class I SAM-dependent methyltransferase [Jatrophihabitans telluris]UQX88614.1 nodulation S family protein [Jatrophihabitans telluris]
MTDLEHLNELFAASEDPWHMRSGWHAQRKRDLLLASLPNSRYDYTFEPGCSAGELTPELARRSERVLAVDGFRESVTATRNRTAHLSNVVVEHRHVPSEWPREQKFDLIVLNEIGSMTNSSDWAALSDAVLGSLTSDATVLACHWRHHFPGRTLSTDTLHGLLDSILGLPRQTKVTDADFTIAVWTTRPRTTTERDGTF